MRGNEWCHCSDTALSTVRVRVLSTEYGVLGTYQYGKVTVQVLSHTCTVGVTVYKNNWTTANQSRKWQCGQPWCKKTDKHDPTATYHGRKQGSTRLLGRWLKWLGPDGKVYHDKACTQQLIKWGCWRESMKNVSCHVIDGKVKFKLKRQIKPIS